MCWHSLQHRDAKENHRIIAPVAVTETLLGHGDTTATAVNKLILYRGIFPGSFKWGPQLVIFHIYSHHISAAAYPPVILGTGGSQLVTTIAICAKGQSYYCREKRG